MRARSTLERGMYPRATRHTRRFQDARGAAVRGSGTKLTWAELTPGKILYLVRMLASSSTDGTGARRRSTRAWCCTRWRRGSGRRS